MIVVLVALIAVALFTAVIMLKKKESYEYEYDLSKFTCALLGGVAVIALIVLLICAFVNHAEGPGKHAEYRARYEALTFEAESGFYNNDNEYGKKELMDQIREWNESVSEGKAMQRNFWVGIFIPNIYDDLEPIRLSTEDL